MSDPALGAEFQGDPLTTEVPLQKLFGIVGTVRLFGKPGRNLSPGILTRLMIGCDGIVGGPRSVHRLVDGQRSRAGFTDVTIVLHPDARHELFSEVMQSDVRGDLTAWLDLRATSRVRRSSFVGPLRDKPLT